MKIGIQGEPGSYHDIVAKKVYGNNCEIIPANNFSELFNSLINKRTDIIIAALANSIYGFIGDSFKELIDNSRSINIIGEYYLPIRHQLLVKKGTKLSEIEEIMSQSVAIGQCSKFIESNLPNSRLIEFNDTASSARFVATTNSKNTAAIASQEAADLYGLDVVANNIQDNANNTTRFLIIERNKNNVSKESFNKITALLVTSQGVGSLADALMIYKNNNINITSLHSSFLQYAKFEMQFLIEFDIDPINISIEKVIDELKKVGSSLRIFGKYNAFQDS